MIEPPGLRAPRRPEKPEAPDRSGDSVETRLLAIALRHIRRDGAGRLTVVRIAEEAGMTHANVYRYFASKSAIGERIVTDWLRGLEVRLSDIAQAPDPADDKLERYLTLLARAYEDKAAGDPQVFAVFAAAAEEGAPYAARHRQRMRELLRRVLEEGGGTGVFPRSDVRRMERFVLDAHHLFFDPRSVAMTLRRAAAGLDGRRARITRFVLRELISRT